MKEKKLQYASLVLGVVLTVVLIVNTALSTIVMYSTSFTASIGNDPGEKLSLSIKSDAGRPSLINYLWTQVRGWTGAWFVGGASAQNATVGLTVQVTGSNVASTATVDYYIEARETGGSGSAYRFLEATGQSVTVGGAGLQTSDLRSIDSHLEAMGLSTGQSWTIDYYVYVKAQATGTISGETLTSEISYTKFDTVTYTYGTEATLSGKPRASSEDYRISGGTWSSTATVSQIHSAVLSGFLARDGVGYYEIPQGATITNAYICFKAASASYNVGSGSGCNVTIRAEKKGLTSSGECTSASDFNSRARTNSEVTWAITEAWTSLTLYNSPDLKYIIQEVVNEATWQGTARCVQIFMDDPTGTSENYRSYRTYDDASTFTPILYISYVSYSASWYPIPPLSIVELPVTLDLVAITSTIVALVVAAREIIRRKKNE